jgi:hypothetical protein
MLNPLLLPGGRTLASPFPALGDLVGDELGVVLDQRRPAGVLQR